MIRNSSLNSAFLGRFIVVCIAVIAFSSGIMAFNFLEITPLAAVAAGTAVFCLLYLGYNQKLMAREINEMRRLLSEPEDFEGDILRRLYELTRKIEAQTSPRQSPDTNQLAKLELAITELNRQHAELSKKITETGISNNPVPDDDPKVIPLHNPKLEKPAPARRPAIADGKYSGPGKNNVDTPPPVAIQRHIAAAGGKKTPDDWSGAKKLSTATAAGDLELNLQPVMNLLNREPVYYQALLGVGSKEDEIVDTGLIPKTGKGPELAAIIDTQLVSDAVRMLRALDNLDRRTGLLCRISASTLRNFDNIFSLLKANRVFADSLILEFCHSEWLGLDDNSRDQLFGIVELGYALCLKDCRESSHTAMALHSAGIRFVKMAAANLSNPQTGEFTNSLDNAGIAVIGSKIEYEYQLLDLIDAGLTLGIGSYFAPPRPVKSELLGPKDNSTDSAIGQ